ncbi:hypothetical protein Tco_1335803 [Tanacetum coccineum]
MFLYRSTTKATDKKNFKDWNPLLSIKVLEDTLTLESNGTGIKKEQDTMHKIREKDTPAELRSRYQTRHMMKRQW